MVDAPEGRGDPSRSGSRPEEFPGQYILNRRSPREVLELLFEGDPLNVHEGVCRRIEERCFLADHHTVSVRTFARVARAGILYRGNPPLGEWLRQRFDHSIREILREDLEDELRGTPVDRRQPRIHLLAKSFGVEPYLGRRACIRFNGLPDRVRDIFFRVQLQGETPLDYAEARGVAYERVLDDLQRALSALGGARHPLDLDLPNVPEFPW